MQFRWIISRRAVGSQLTNTHCSFPRRMNALAPSNAKPAWGRRVCCQEGAGGTLRCGFSRQKAAVLLSHPCASRPQDRKALLSSQGHQLLSHHQALGSRPHGGDRSGKGRERWAKTGHQGCASQPALPRSSPLPQATFWIFSLPDALSHTQARLAIPLQAMGLTVGGPHSVDAIPDSMQFSSMVCHSHEAGHLIQPEKGDIYMLCLFYYY